MGDHLLAGRVTGNRFDPDSRLEGDEPLHPAQGKALESAARTRGSRRGGSRVESAQRIVVFRLHFPSLPDPQSQSQSGYGDLFTVEPVGWRSLP